MTDTRLTDTDRSAIARAREVAALSGEEIRLNTGYDDPAMALAAAFGSAQHLLGELAAIITRLDGSDERES
jgi:hypothetical protein